MMSWSRVLPALVALCLLTACTSSGPSTQPVTKSPTPVESPIETAPPALAKFYDQKVHWQGCHGGFECAKVRVPVDYTAPTGASITLSAVRLPSHGGDRLGSLL